MDSTQKQTSTGPRTPAGKAASSQNARKSGWFARDLRLAGSQQSAYVEFEAAWREELAPATLAEDELFSDFVRAAWHKREIVAAQNELTVSAHAAFLDEALAKQLDRLHRYERDFERRAARHLATLRRLQAERIREPQKRTPSPPESLSAEDQAQLYSLSVRSQFFNAMVRACRAGLIDPDTGHATVLAHVPETGFGGQTHDAP